MRQQSREYIVILFIGGFLAINYPVLALFDRPWTLLGIPLLYFYLYLAWFILIILLIFVVENSEIRLPEEHLSKPISPKSDHPASTGEGEATPPTEPS